MISNPFWTEKSTGYYFWIKNGHKNSYQKNLKITKISTNATFNFTEVFSKDDVSFFWWTVTLKELAFVIKVRLFSFLAGIMHSSMSVSRPLIAASRALFFSFASVISTSLSFCLRLFSCETVGFFFLQCYNVSRMCQLTAFQHLVG